MTVYQVPNDRVRTLPLVQAMEEHLANILDFGVPPVSHGRLLITTKSQDAWSLRAYSQTSTREHSASIMFFPGQGRVRFSAEGHLKTYITGPEGAAAAAVDDLMSLLSNIGSDEGQQYILLPEDLVLSAMDALAPIIARIVR